MPTTLSTPSSTNVKLRFEEPYVSDGLNRKQFGLTGRGVVRGGRLETAGSGLNINVVVDPTTGDSVYSCITSAGHQLTYRDTSNRTIDLTPVASTDVYVALHVDYSIGSDTVAEFRAYTESELFGAMPVAEADEVVVLGFVSVPVGGPIGAGSVGHAQRREAWADQSLGLRPWKNVVFNGDFELGGTSDASWTGAKEDIVPGFRHLISAGTPIIEVTTSNPQSGKWALRWAVSSGTAEATLVERGSGGTALPAPYQPVRAGQLIYMSFYLAGTDVPANVGSPALLSVLFYTETGAPIGFPFSASADPTTETGTFGYKRLEAVVAAPADGYFTWGITFAFDVAASPTSEMFVDDIAVLLQPHEEPLLTPDAPRFGQLRAQSFALDSAGLVASEDRHAHTVELISQYQSGSGPTPVRMYQLDGTVFDFTLEADLTLSGGISSGVSVDETPLLESTELPTSKYKLVHKNIVGQVSGTDVFHRQYVRSDTPDFGLVSTINAEWDSATSLWTHDTAERISIKYSWATNGGMVREFKRISPEEITVLLENGSWLDEDWERNSDYVAREPLAIDTPAYGSISAVAGSGLVDGETFTLDDGTNPPVTFEFDSNGSVVETSTLRQVAFTGGDSELTVATSIGQAINNAPVLNITANWNFPVIRDSAEYLGIVLLDHDSDGEIGNNPITDTVANPLFTTRGMLGGVLEANGRSHEGLARLDDTVSSDVADLALSNWKKQTPAAAYTGRFEFVLYYRGSVPDPGIASPSSSNSFPPVWLVGGGSNEVQFSGGAGSTVGRMTPSGWGQVGSSFPATTIWREGAVDNARVHMNSLGNTTPAVVLVGEDSGGPVAGRTGAGGAWSLADISPSVLTTGIRGVAFGDVGGTDATWVTVGGSGEIATSRESDGQLASAGYPASTADWTARTAASGFSSQFYRVRYLDGAFYAVGNAGEIQRSTDGVTWSRIMGSLSTLDILDIAFGDGVYVAVARTGQFFTLYRSTDGTNFNQIKVDTGFNAGYGNIVFWRGLFIVGTDSFGDQNPLLVSKGGLYWSFLYGPQEALDGATTDEFNAIGASPNQIVVAGDNGGIYSSLALSLSVGPFRRQNERWPREYSGG